MVQIQDFLVLASDRFIDSVNAEPHICAIIMPQSPPFQTGFLNNDAAVQWNNMLPAYYPASNDPELYDNNMDEFLTKDLSRWGN
ncbi:hypothetical protein PENSTE_c011G00007 [Penicillium steckii]|uniref:Uncharacterized protein n=1 Tax=Penicillium steckii TaxID=303698 RepID=A0A1V6T5R1_9EURO|nr:hypothetical protein PENSTE_c011G00007 [Penicillium steckii]